MSTAPLADGWRLVRLQRVLFWTTIALFVVSAAVLTWRAGAIFEHDLSPEVSLKGHVLARSLTVQVNRALALDIPIEHLVGMDEFLDDFIEAHTEIAYVAVTNANNEVLYIRGVSIEDVRSSLQGHPFFSERTFLIVGKASYYNTRLPLANQLGALHVGVRANYVRKRMMEIGADAVIVLFVSVLIAFEVLTLLISAGIKARINSVMRLMRHLNEGNFAHLAMTRGNDELDHLARRLNHIVTVINNRFAQLQEKLVAQARVLPERLSIYRFAQPPTIEFRPALEAIRVPLFLFVLSEELSRSFLPIFARELAGTMTYIPLDVVVSLPICVYMLVFAIATPFAGNLADRFGNRPIFMLGAICSIIGFVWLAFVSSFMQLIIARVFCAAGYSIATIAVQNYLVSNAPTGSQARAQALFVGGVMIAGMAGTSFGGVLAERIGYRMTFGVGAVTSAIALLVFYSSPDTATLKKTGDAQRRRFRFLDLWQLLKVRRFAGLMLFAAIPAKILLAGFLFYLTPLYLMKLGFSQSDIGRSVMMYFLLVYFGNYLSSWLADRFGMRWSLVVAGGCIAGVGLLSILVVPQESLAILIGIACLGLGTAISTAPMMAIATGMFSQGTGPAATAVVVAVRLLERFGSFVGPLIAAAAVAFAGYRGAIVVIGTLGSISAVALWLSFVIGRPHKKAATNP